MKLRSQMLLAGVLTLAVPLVGWQSVKQLYSALQQNRIDEQTLKVANMRLALAEAESVNEGLAQAQMTTGDKDWYAQSSPYPLFVDGYADDWQELTGPASYYEIANTEAAADSGFSVSVRTARIADSLFLFVSVVDDKLLFHTPPRLIVDAGEGEWPDRQAQLVNGDSLDLLMRYESGWQHGLFRAIAPGPIVALRASDRRLADGRVEPKGMAMPEWQGAWVTSVDGYQLELQMPLPPAGSVIGLAAIDVDEVGQPRTVWAGSLAPQVMQQANWNNTAPENVQGGLLFYDNTAAQNYLQRWTTAGVRTRIFDVHGRLLADVNNLYAKGLAPDQEDEDAHTSSGLLDAILLRVFAFFVAGDLPLLPETRSPPSTYNLSAARRGSLVGDVPFTSRYVTDENDRVLGTLAPIGSEPRRGYLLFEANEEHTSAYAGSQMARLFSLLLLVSILAGSGLLIFAFVLSTRIRRLSQQAQLAIADDGRVTGLPDSYSKDEIGDLSRKLSSLLSRSAAYTHYLEALASRLSHELRTPLSVVRTSIENLDRNTMDEQTRQLVDRASGGAEHLASIIRALVESTRLEQSVQWADHETIDLHLWLEGCLARYSQVYPDTQFLLSPTPMPAVAVHASPELLQQAFDKLVDNAVSFATADPVLFHLKLELEGGVRKVSIGVANQGAVVDASLLDQWFEPLYSEHRTFFKTDDESGSQAPKLSGQLSGGESMHLGLGLYIVRMIAESHGGSTYAEHHTTPDNQSWVHVGLRLDRI